MWFSTLTPPEPGAGTPTSLAPLFAPARPAGSDHFCWVGVGFEGKKVSSGNAGSEIQSGHATRGA
jgi:hypothetical protein